MEGRFPNVLDSCTSCDDAGGMEQTVMQDDFHRLFRIAQNDIQLMV